MSHPLISRPGAIAPLNSPQRDFILLDGSSSMAYHWRDMLGAIQSYVDGLRTANTDTFLTLSLFAGTCLSQDHANCPIAEWPSLRECPPKLPYGDTPLFDAINLAARRLHDENPTRCALTIVTDGEEGGSTHTSEIQARAILDWVRAKGWQVTFIGCDFDNSHLARALGANRASAIGVAKAHLIGAASELARKRTCYGATGAPMHWSESEQRQFGGYLGRAS